MGLAKRDERRYTYGEYLGWPEETRYELVEGIAYAMAPASSRLHQEVLGELFLQVGNALRGAPCRVFIAPFDVRLPRAAERDEEVDTVVQPDLSVVCDVSKLDERGCRGGRRTGSWRCSRRKAPDTITSSSGRSTSARGCGSAGSCTRWTGS